MCIPAQSFSRSLLGAWSRSSGTPARHRVSRDSTPCVSLAVIVLASLFTMVGFEKSNHSKETRSDFEEKRFTVTIGEDEREFDKENEVFRDWNYRITRDVKNTA